MIPRDQIPVMMRKLDTPYCRVMDMSGKLLWMYEEGTSADAAANALADAFTWLTSYGRVMVWGANASQFKGKWTHCYKWECLVGDGSAVPTKTGSHSLMQPQSITQQFTEMVTLLGALDKLRGSPNNDMQLQLIKQQYDFEKKIDELKREQENNGGKWVAAAVPFIGKALGMDATQIQQTQAAIAGTPAVAAAPAYAGPLLTTDIPTVEDIIKLTDEQKVEQCQSLLNMLPEKIDGSKMIVLFHLLIKNPEYADLLIGLNRKVPAEKIVRLMAALDANPQYVDTALTFIK